MTSWKNNNTLESRRLVEEVLDPVKKSEKVVARDRSHLEELIEEAKRAQGPNCDLNHIDVSRITDMSFLFYESDFSGDISKWDVSKVKNKTWMFKDSPLEGKEPDWYKS